jgi:hypothetical protein
MTTDVTAAVQIIEAYLDAVAARLRGPRSRRSAVMVELRDGLDQAVADHLARGMSAADAVAAAIARFGEPGAVADSFAGELATAYVRRVIGRYLITGPLVGIWWLWLLHPHPWRAGLLALVVAVPAVPLIGLAIALGAGTLATTGRLMRWLPETGPGRALAATVGIASLCLLGDVTVIVTYALSGSPIGSLAAIAIAASLTRIVASLLIVGRATRMSRAHG